MNINSYLAFLKNEINTLNIFISKTQEKIKASHNFEETYRLSGEITRAITLKKNINEILDAFKNGENDEFLLQVGKLIDGIKEGNNHAN